jgi:hypothetical protein
MSLASFHCRAQQGVIRRTLGSSPGVGEVIDSSHSGVEVCVGGAAKGIGLLDLGNEILLRRQRFRPALDLGFVKLWPVGLLGLQGIPLGLNCLQPSIDLVKLLLTPFGQRGIGSRGLIS